MYHLCTEPDRKELYVLSNTVTQSNDAVFAGVRSIYENSPALHSILNPRWSKGYIENIETRSKIQVLTSTTEGLLGKDAFLIVNDEIAFWKDRRMYANMKGSQLNQEEPLNISITTASDNLEGVGKELYDYAVKVRDGVIEDDTFLPAIFEASPTDDWRSPETWKKANPSLGVLLKESDLKKLADEAAAEPRKQSEFQMFHCDRWQHSSICWLSKETWDSCKHKFNEDELIGKKCYGGLDLARRHDLAAWVMLFPVNDEYWLLPRFFLPGDNIIAKEQQDHAPYRTWEQQGYLTLTDGDVIDYAKIREQVRADAQKFKLDQCAYDPWSAELLANQQLRQEDGIDFVEVRQRIDLISPACMQFERLLREKKIRHNNNPVLNWHANNVVIRTDNNGNIMPDKKHATARFDGITAAIMALSRALEDPGIPALILF